MATIPEKLMGRCFYEKRQVDTVSLVWICKIHNKHSQYIIDEGSRKPCIELDPWR